MMDGIIGYISINFIAKNVDLLAAYFTVTAGFLYFYFAKFQLDNIDNKIKLIFFDFSKVIKKHLSPQSSITLYFLSTIILIFNVINQSQDIFYTFITLIMFFYFARLGGPKFYFWSTVIFLTKTFFSGEYIVGDAFHGAESFLASFWLKNGFFSVFPNIGYLEELPPIIFAKVLEVLTLGKVTMSIATSKSIIVNFLQLSTLYFLFTKNKLAAFLAVLCLPYDRLSLLFLLCYTCFFLYHFEKFNKDSPARKNIYFYKLLILTPFPLLALISSPSYLIIPFLGLTILIPMLFKDVKFLFALIFSWTLIYISFHNIFEYYLSVYWEFSREHLLAYATPLKMLSLFDLLFIFFIIFSLSAIILSPLDTIRKYKLKIIVFLCILVILKIYIQYAFGRVDPGYARFFPLAISLLIVYTLAYDRYRYLISLIFIFIGVKFQVLHFTDFNINNLLNTKLYKSNSLVKLDTSLNDTASRINNFAGERNVVIYSDPALAIGVKNSTLPPFTTPYVTVGSNNQNRVISFLKNNPKSIIFLGTSFITYDGVDVRLRAPRIFRHLAENYYYEKVDGLIYAIPREQKPLSNKSGEIFFNGMDLGKSALFYRKFYLDEYIYRRVYVECSGNSIFKYTVKNSGNYLLADLRCGDNFIPEIYFNGEIYSVRKL